MNFPEGYNSKLSEMLEEATRIWYNEPQKALEISNYVYISSLKSADERNESRALYCMGVCNEMMCNYPKAIHFLSEAIKLATKLNEKKIIADSLNCIGIINDNISNYSSSLRAYLKALKIYEELDLKRNKSIVLSNIGLVYTNIHDYRNALKFYSQALEIAEDEQDEESVLITSINIGLTHFLLGNNSDAMKFLTEALLLAEKRKDDLRKSISLDHMVDVKMSQGHYSEAYFLLEESRSIKVRLNDKKGLVKIYFIFGQINLKEGKVQEALNNTLEALRISEEIGLKKSVFEIHKMLSEIYEKVGDTSKSLHHLKFAYKKEIEYLKEKSEEKARNLATQIEIEQAQKEAEIQRLRNVELANALEEVKALNLSLQELNEEKNEFMSIAVHDLKNPLQNILSSARLLKRQAEVTNTELIDNIISQTDRMFNLIKRLLDHQSIEEGNINIKVSEFDNCSFISEVSNVFSDTASAKNIELICDCREKVRLKTDREILFQIIQNLVSNSLKFSPSGKKVFVRTYSSGEHVMFEVEDEGPGFSEEDKNKVFKKFARLSARPTGGEHSTGLGLSAVKKLCELINADIELESEQYKGATFIIKLPLSA
ncbi:MAG: tetratricopeptide repeat-containing sensor histidine kinase [Ignavibacteria bacterium]|nr:tetratricopeptide repeat-containing sensor histidine kinase [Ignavibacteria bacterium]